MKGLYKAENKRSTGAEMKERIVIEEGKRFGRLTVLNRANEYTKYGYAIWNCQCDCGNIVKVSSTNLRYGHTKSCGCLKRETVIRTHTKHNLSRNRINKIYLAMKTRCYCKTSDRYSYYGGRGIKICDEWLKDFMLFYKWAMDNGYNDKLTIDRINVNGNYEPSNCRWITKGEQTRNTRRNRIYKGKCFSEWARELGISPQSFWERVEKFGIKKAVEFKDNFHKVKNSMLNIEELKKDYYKMTNEACAKKHNISKRCLTDILNKFKIIKKSCFYGCR